MMAVTAPSIDQLQELALPAPAASYLPQTWGWLALLLVLATIAAICLVLRWRRWQRDRYRREALARLDALAQSLTQALGQRERRLRALRELPELLKRVALSMPGAPPVARLGGAQWQAFLVEHATLPVPDGFAARLAICAYAPEERLAALSDAEVEATLATCRQWIETHHVAV